MIGIICDGSSKIEYDGITWTHNRGRYHNKDYGLIYRYIWKKHVGPIPKKYHIHHKNNNILDNRISNLSMMLPSEHAKITHTGRKLSEETKNRLSESNKGKLAKKVLCIEKTKIYSSAEEAIKDIGLRSRSSIAMAASGFQKTAGGYHWKYIEG